MINNDDRSDEEIGDHSAAEIAEACIRAAYAEMQLRDVPLKQCLEATASFILVIIQSRARGKNAVELCQHVCDSMVQKMVELESADGS